MKKAKTPKPDVEELCGKLTSILYSTDGIRNTAIVCSYAAQAQSQSELHEEMEFVLRRHVCDPLFGQLLVLNKIIVSLGGEGNERFNDDDKDDANE